MKLAIGVPTAIFVKTKHLADQMAWAFCRVSGGEKTYRWDGLQVTYELDAFSGRNDVARSRLFHTAKMSEADAHLQMDSDCLILSFPIEMVLAMVSENFDNGYDCVVLPIASAGGGDDRRIMVTPCHPDGSINREFQPKVGMTGTEISGGAFGAVFFSGKCLRRLLPMEELHKSVEGTSVPMYCVNGVGGTEDYDLCRRIREAGMRIWADFRIPISHFKETGITLNFGPPPTGTGQSHDADQMVYRRMLDAERDRRLKTLSDEGASPTTLVEKIRRR